jgi:hypothetical protein
MLLRRRKLLWSRCEDVVGSRRTQPPVDCLWSLVPSFPGLSVNSDNLPFSYVILFLLFTYVNYMHENWSWHAYGFALGFLQKVRCDTFSLFLKTTSECFSSIAAAAWLELTLGILIVVQQRKTLTPNWKRFISLEIRLVERQTTAWFRFQIHLDQGHIARRDCLGIDSSALNLDSPTPFSLRRFDFEDRSFKFV